MPDGILGKLLVLILLLAVGLFLLKQTLLGFMAQRTADYADTGPPFDLQASFAGPLTADGVLYGPTGRVSTRFVADMNATWDASHGTLTESFRYSTGRTQERAWRITLGSNGRFTATADDVVGTAEGESSGATAVMRYRLRLPEDAGGWQLDVTDWLYRGEDGVIVNRSQFRRFGVLLGELVGTIRPADK